ncbi:CheR family methyltransferase [Litoribrevibacter euphylliae]|uniref:Chemotaxis protein methyltransferase n=1 Tax=Litoribrevibacter euphylliae TaxID=1834034 RepID=A0ABV7HB66_9GAMM
MSHDLREFPMTDSNFEHIRGVAYQRTGIVLGDHKREMVYSRLARRCRVLGVTNFDEYIHILESSEADELSHFVNSITTNLTSFFREGHHFEFLLETVLPEVFDANTATRRVRIWSAGCSTGEEPYSLAITVHKFLKKNVTRYKGWDVKILATDLDSNVLSHGRHGVYRVAGSDGLSAEDRREYFDELDQGNEHELIAKDKIRSLIIFNRLNLLHKWPMKGQFDVIFCRNVVIYFDKETQKVLFDRYANILKDPGYLMIGHSENLHRVTDRFKALGGTRYKKVC